MKKTFLSAVALAIFLGVPSTPIRAQGANPLTGGGNERPGIFVIKAITVATPKTPEFSTVGGESQAKRYALGNWLEVEVEFSSSSLAREVNFRYNILIANTLLTGEETVVDVPAGQSLFTVMYVAPRTLTTLLRGAPLTPNSVQNIDVQIQRPGVAAPLANKMLKDGPAFYATMQQVPGFVLPKTETPFAPLWWDRYEAVKPAK